MIALRSLFGFLGRHRADLTLLVVAIAAAALWAAYASVRADRDATLNMAERICAAAGSEFVVKQGTPGAACAKQVARLARFKAQAQEKTNEALITAMHEREAKQARDAERRQARLEARLTALATMTTAEEEVHDDQVSGSWFTALNRLAGLRAPAR